MFGGTDYGLATISRTAPLTVDVVQAQCNRFWILGDQTGDTLPEAAYSLPPAFSITASQLDCTSHALEVRKKREKKRVDKPYKDALGVVSGNSFTSALSMDNVDNTMPKSSDANTARLSDHLRLQDDGDGTIFTTKN